MTNFFVNLKSIFMICINSIVKLFLEIFIFDRKIRRILKGNWAKFYLKGLVKKINKDYVHTQKSNSEPYRIWQYWEQGVENAPELVKACLDSVAKQNPDMKRVIIKFEDIKNYVEIPQFIYDLKEKGIIKSAHFADILRTFLLAEHGGCWIDATMFLTEHLPKYVTDSEVFILKCELSDDVDGFNMANYFLSSRDNSILFGKMKNFLVEYWKHNHFTINYFFYHHAFAILSELSEENENEWERIPFHSFIPPQQLQYELLNKFDTNRWEQIKKMAPFHKLTHKRKILSKQKDIDFSGTFYEKIIKREI